VGTAWPLREDRHIAGLELALAVRPAQRRPTHDRDQPLLATDLVVVRPRLLTRRQLIQAAAQQARAEPLPDRGDAMALAVAVALAVPRRLPKEVEDLHQAIVVTELPAPWRRA